MALQRHPELTQAFVDLGHEIAEPRLALDPLPAHGRGQGAPAHRHRHPHHPRPDRRAVAARLVHRTRQPQRKRLVADYGGYEYDSDYYGDDLPFWMPVETDGSTLQRLIVPYTLDTNDMRFASMQGFNTGEQFFQYPEGLVRRALRRGRPGRRRPSEDAQHRHALPAARAAGRFRALQRFLDHVQQHDHVWICRRIDIARHWAATPRRRATAPGLKTMNQTPLTLERLNAAPLAQALAWLDGLYEHSPWIAEGARGAAVREPRADEARARAWCARPGREAQLALIRAHPELAGKAMVTKTLTAEIDERAGKAGLTDCTAEEFARIQQLNADYNAKFGFPFVLPCAARAAPPDQGADHRDVRAAPGQPPRLRTRRVPRNIHRIAEIRLERQVRRHARVRQPGLGLGERLAAEQRSGLCRARRTHRHVSHRCAPRLRQRLAHWMKSDCGFDEVEIDAVGNVVGIYHGSDRSAKRLLTGPLRHGAQRRQVRRAPGHPGADGLRARTAPRQAGACRSTSKWSFAEEEGQRYKATFLGSGALTGQFDPAWLEQKDADGVSMRDAMVHAGLCHRRHSQARARRVEVPRFVEAHIEQGAGAQRDRPAARRRDLDQRQRALRRRGGRHGEPRRHRR